MDFQLKKWVDRNTNIQIHFMQIGQVILDGGAILVQGGVCVCVWGGVGGGGVRVELDIQLNFSGSNTDGSFNKDISNLFLSPLEKSYSCRFGKPVI